jgi:hypothetical protein
MLVEAKIVDFQLKDYILDRSQKSFFEQVIFGDIFWSFGNRKHLC